MPTDRSGSFSRSIPQMIHNRWAERSTNSRAEEATKPSWPMIRPARDRARRRRKYPVQFDEFEQHGRWDLDALSDGVKGKDPEAGCSATGSRCCLPISISIRRCDLRDESCPLRGGRIPIRIRCGGGMGRDSGSFIPIGVSVPR
jgi:hypothetical protein